MKNLSLLAGLAFCIFFQTFCQPQWRFHIAFEDATGAKDTLWFIWDSTATIHIDPSFGEGNGISDPNAFNVFSNDYADSSKVLAFPFVASSFQIYAEAINYSQPLNITWDSSLFSRAFSGSCPTITEARIDNNYFVFNSNDPPMPYFNMLIDNHVVAPSYSWGSGLQFPMRIYISRVPSTGIPHLLNEKVVSGYPNPTEGLFFVKSDDVLASVEISSIKGELIQYIDGFGRKSIEVDLSGLPNGIYFLTSKTLDKKVSHNKIILQKD